RLVERFARPVAAQDIIRPARAGTPDQVQRHDGILGRGPALHEQDLEIIRYRQQGPQIGFGLVTDTAVVLAAMAHFHDGGAAALPVAHFLGGLLQDLERQGGRPRRKIPGTLHHAGSSPVWASAAPSVPGPAPSAADADTSPSAVPSSGASSSASLSATRRTPESWLSSSTLIRVTPWVARPISRISETRVRTSTPLVVISMISSSGLTSTALTTLPLRAEVWMAIMPLVPRPWRVYSAMD